MQHQLKKKDSGDFPASFWFYSTASDFGGSKSGLQGKRFDSIPQ